MMDNENVYYNLVPTSTRKVVDYAGGFYLQSSTDITVCYLFLFKQSTMHLSLAIFSGVLPTQDTRKTLARHCNKGLPAITTHNWGPVSRHEMHISIGKHLGIL